MKKQLLLSNTFRRNSRAICSLSTFIFVCFLSSCGITTFKKEQDEHPVLQRWKKAVIQLEGATDSKSMDERRQRRDDLTRKFNDGKISREEYIQEISKGTKDVRFQGTAIFLEHESRHYLITARHVLFDEISAERELEQEKEGLRASPPDFRANLLKGAYERAQNTIFHIIFRVPSIDEKLQEQASKPPKFLMNLSAGPYFTHPYTFTAPDIDLAIISLDNRNSDFIKELKSIGYEPIHLNDITDEPSSEGVEVFIIGYPSFSTFNLNLNQTITNWSSAFASIPNYAFGKVSMLHQKLPFFWCDISVYPGFSGSPVIENDKLVGIVSGQQRIPIDRVVKTAEGEKIEPDPMLLMRIPFGNIIKAKFVKPLLEEQIKKDINSRK
jgi:hypothetical protein